MRSRKQRPSLPCYFFNSSSASIFNHSVFFNNPFPKLLHSSRKINLHLSPRKSFQRHQLLSNYFASMLDILGQNPSPGAQLPEWYYSHNELFPSPGGVSLSTVIHSYEMNDSWSKIWATRSIVQNVTAILPSAIHSNQTTKQYYCFNPNQLKKSLDRSQQGTMIMVDVLACDVYRAAGFYRQYLQLDFFKQPQGNQHTILPNLSQMALAWSSR